VVRGMVVLPDVDITTSSNKLQVMPDSRLLG
jgi:hypothetical protein